MIASYDISYDLKMAGFPQPEPKSGQFWYDSYRNLSVLSLVGQAPGAEPKIMVLILDGEDTYETVQSEMGGFVFAPTESDILPYVGCFLEWDFNLLKFGIGWDGLISFVDNSADGLAQFHLAHSNPADLDGL